VEADKSQATGDQNHDAAPLDRHFPLRRPFVVRSVSHRTVDKMFAQLRKSATVTEKLKPMIQGRFTARSDRAAAD
jgi:hypothetical protein